MTTAEAEALRDRTNCILIKTRTHQLYSRTYGGRNSRNNSQQVASDSLNLRRAFQLDCQAIRPYLIEDGNTADAVDDAFRRLDRLNRQDHIY